MYSLPNSIKELLYLREIDEVYSIDEAKNIVDFISSQNLELATNNPVFRNQDRVIVDNNEMASDLFERIKNKLPQSIENYELFGINPRLRMYRYTKGQYFAPHTDHWYVPCDGQISLLTLLIYLNEDFEGGTTNFMDGFEKTVIPKTGKVLVFQHKLRHEGAEVLSGQKFAVRTDVIYKATPT